MRLLIKTRRLSPFFAFAALLISSSSFGIAQPPQLSPQELAQRHEAMFNLIQTAEIVTDFANGADSSVRETTYFWMDGEKRRFATEPIDRSRHILECYFDGTMLFQIQRRNADIVIPTSVDTDTNDVMGMILLDDERERFDSTLWMATLRFRLTWADADWSLPQLVKASTPPATSEVVLEKEKYLYKLSLRHPGIRSTMGKAWGGAGGDLSIFLDPNRNFAAVRVESDLQSIHEGKPISSQSVLSTSGEWMHSQGVWIPTHSEWKVLVDGKQPTHFRSHDIELVQLNQPLDPKIMQWQFPENLLVCEVDKAGVTHDMHIVDAKGAFKETFKTPQEYGAWRNQQMLGGPYWSALLVKWPFFAGGLMFLLFTFLLWRFTRQNVQPARAD